MRLALPFVALHFATPAFAQNIDAGTSRLNACTLRVRVRDASTHRPISGASIENYPGMELLPGDKGSRFRGEPPPKADFLEVDAGIWVAMNAAPGEYTLQVNAEGYLYAKRSISVAGAVTETVFDLKRGVALRGRVVAANPRQGGVQPISKARVCFTPEAHNELPYDCRNPDSTGAFLLYVPPGAGSIVVRASGYHGASIQWPGPQGSPVLFSLDDESGFDVQLMLPDGGPARGARVVVQEFGARLRFGVAHPGDAGRDPLTRAELIDEAARPDPMETLELHMFVHAEPDEHGHVKVAPLDVGRRYRLYAVARGFDRSASADVEATLGIHPLTLQLRPGLPFRGVAIDEQGEPLVGVELSIGSVNVTTKEGGVFEGTGLEAGDNYVGLLVRLRDGSRMDKVIGRSVPGGDMNILLEIPRKDLPKDGG